MKEIVSFFLSGKKYAVEVSHMQGIEKYRKVIQPGGMPEFLEGVADIRGEMTPIVDIRTKLRLPPTQVTEKTKLLVFRTTYGWLACIVDGIPRILKVEGGDIQQFPLIAQTEENRYADFVARNDGELVLVIDPQNLLDGGEWKSVKQMFDRMEEEEDD